MFRFLPAAFLLALAGPALSQTVTSPVVVDQGYVVDLDTVYSGAPLPGYSDAQFLSGASSFVCSPAQVGGGSYWSGGTVGQPYGDGTIYAPPAYTPAPPVYQPVTPTYGGVVVGYGDGGGDPVPFGLAGTSWRVVEIDGRPATATQILNFASATGFGGRAACNAYSGEFMTGPGLSIDFGGIIATRVACAALSEEQAYFNALGRAASYRIGREGDGFALLDAAGATIVTFVPATAPDPQPVVDLTGAWRVVGIQTDTGFENSDPQLAALSFSFDGTNRFRANGGCNDFLGDYNQTGGSLQFGTIAVTARQCFAPSPFEDDMGRNLPNVRGVRGDAAQVDLVDSGGEPLFALAR